MALNGGIIDQASNAKSNYDDAARNEMDYIDYLLGEIGDYTGTRIFDQTGKIAGKLYPGDYVNYTPTLGTFNWSDKVNEYTYAEYSGDTSESNVGTMTTDISMKWQVLDIKGGRIRLISEEPVVSVRLEGYNGYNNAVYLLDKISSTLYNGEKGVAKSIRFEDIVDQMNSNPQEQYSEYGTMHSPTNRFYPEMIAKEENCTIDGITGNLPQSAQDGLIWQTAPKQVTSWTLKNTFLPDFTLDSMSYKNDVYFDMFHSTGYFGMATRCVRNNNNAIVGIFRTTSLARIGYYGLYNGLNASTNRTIWASSYSYTNFWSYC